MMRWHSYQESTLNELKQDQMNLDLWPRYFAIKDHKKAIKYHKRPQKAVQYQNKQNKAMVSHTMEHTEHFSFAKILLFVNIFCSRTFFAHVSTPVTTTTTTTTKLLLGPLSGARGQQRLEQWIFGNFELINSIVLWQVSI